MVSASDFLSLLRRSQLPYVLYKAGTYIKKTDNESAIFLVENNYLYTHVQPSKRLIMLSRVPITKARGSNYIFTIYLPEAVSGKVAEGSFTGILTLLDKTGNLRIIIDKDNMQMIVEQNEKSKRRITLNLMRPDEIFKREKIATEEDFIEIIHRRFNRTSNISETGIADFLNGQVHEIGRVTLESSLIKNMVKSLQVLKCDSVPIKFTTGGELVVSYERHLMGDKGRNTKRNRVQEGHLVNWTGGSFSINLDVDVISQFQIISEPTFVLHIFRFHIDDQNRDVDTLALIGNNTIVMFFLPLVEA